MSRKIKIVLNVVAMLCIVAYMVVTFVVTSRQGELIRFTRLDVAVLDSADVRFVTGDSIRQLVFEQVAPIGTPLSQVHLSDIEGRVKLIHYVDSVEVRSSIDGVISVALTQHRPVLRVLGQNGYNFLVDTSFNILRPTISYHPDVPIISGNPCFGFGDDFYGKLDVKKYSNDAENLKKLINFVNFVVGDEFLDRLCAQIFVTCNDVGVMEIEIIPTVGKAFIEVGELADSDEKLSKIKAFYRSAYSYAGLDTASVVDVKYRNQILVR